MSFGTISVIGLGYIGLPTAAMFASKNIKVIGVDVNQYVVDTINKAKIHIVEPDLDTIVSSSVKEGWLKATTKPEPADAFIIAVPTPFRESKSNIPEPDLKYIKAVSKAISPLLKKGDLVILESTSPVGTTEKLLKWLAKERADLVFPESTSHYCDVNVAYCPERVLPGKVVRELVENDRVIGGITEACSQKALELYKNFVQGECVITDARTAEMSKLTENACRDVQIAFANELSIICDKLDIDVWRLISLANRHPRINILQPGPGVGGHCIAVDPWFIASKTPDEAKLIRTARHINDTKPLWVIDKVKLAVSDYLQKNISKKIKDVTIACYGVAFKPDIDDLRESPALLIAEKIAEFHLGRTIVVEPNIKTLPSHTKLELISFDDANIEAHIHVLLVGHSCFSKEKLKNLNLVNIVSLG